MKAPHQAKTTRHPGAARAGELRSRDLCLAITVGPWGGIHMKWWKGVRIWSLNLGFIGFRAWQGDLPGKIVTEVMRLADAAAKEGRIVDARHARLGGSSE